MSHLSLYFTGFKINEIRKPAHFYVLSIYQRMVLKHFKALKILSTELVIIFSKYGYKYLFGQNKPIHQKSLTRMINDYLKNTYKVCNIPYNIKSHSFRINMISNLLSNV